MPLLTFKNSREKLLFRSDTRLPSDVFTNGFRRRAATYEGFLQKVDEIIADTVQEMEAAAREEKMAPLRNDVLLKHKSHFDTLDDTEKQEFMRHIDVLIPLKEKMSIKESIQNEIIDAPTLKQQFFNKFHRKDKQPGEQELDENKFKDILQRAYEPFFDSENKLGMDPSNSVSTTTQMDITAIFPEDQRQDTYVYFLRSETGFFTYEEQQDHPFFFAQEIAIRDIPPSDVLGAVKIKRHFDRSKCYCYEIVGDIEWNLASINDGDTAYKKAQIQTLVNLRKEKFIIIPDANTPASPNNQSFKTIENEYIHDLEVFEKLASLFYKLINESGDCTLLSNQIIDLAKTLHDPTRVLPFREKNLLDTLKGYQAFFESKGKSDIYESLENEFSKLCTKSLKSK